MFRYVMRRLIQFIPVFVFATFLLFYMVFAVPGDPIEALNGEKALDPTTKSVLEDRFNLDDNLFVQYGKYMGILPQDRVEANPNSVSPGRQGIFQGEFGTSFSNRQVSDIMGEAIPKTAKLGVMAFAFEVVLGISAGVLAGLRRGSFMDNLVLVSTTAVIAVPVFVLGFLAQLLFAVRLGWAPVNASGASFGELILPAVVLGALSLAYIARLTRTSLNETLSADFVKTATAKGLPRRRVIGRHALRNSLIPVITFLGIDLGALMGGAIITEGIFNVPGIGREVFQAIQRSDGAVVVGVSTFLVVIFMVSTLVVDIMYAVLDPRIRYE